MSDFLINSPLLQALRPHMEQAKEVIQRAIHMKRPILLRYHNDCDGCSAAIALGNAIYPLVQQVLLQNAWKYFKKLPSKAPYYTYTDATKDMEHYMADRNKYDKPMPLVIILDNGSSEEDLLAIQKVKLHGGQVVVIDHHHPGDIVEGKCAVDVHVDAHVNPHKVEEEGNMCTGMLCVELGRMLNPDVEDMSHIAAIAGHADRAEGHERDQYYKLALQKDFDEEFIQKVSAAINWECFHTGFFDAKNMLGVLLGERTKEQEHMVQLSHSHIVQERERHMESVRFYLREKQQGSLVIASLDVDKLSHYGDYFSSGKMTSLSFAYLEEKYPKDHVIMMGMTPTSITFRATHGIVDKQGNPFDVNSLITQLQKEAPHALITGGGHAVAGTMRFLEAAREKIVGRIQTILGGMK